MHCLALHCFNSSYWTQSKIHLHIKLFNFHGKFPSYSISQFVFACTVCFCLYCVIFIVSLFVFLLSYYVFFFYSVLFENAIVTAETVNLCLNEQYKNNANNALLMFSQRFLFFFF